MLPPLVLESLGPFAKSPPLSPLSSSSLPNSQRKQRPQQAPPRALRHRACVLVGVHLTQLVFSKPSESDPNLCRESWPRPSSPSQSEPGLPPLSLYQPAHPEEETHVVSDEHVPSTPPPLHTPLFLFHPSPSPVFSLVNSSQYVMGRSHPLPLPPTSGPCPLFLLVPRLLLSPRICSHSPTPLPPAAILQLMSPVRVSIQTSLQASAQLPSVPRPLKLNTANTAPTFSPTAPSQVPYLDQ